MDAQWISQAIRSIRLRGARYAPRSRAISSAPIQTSACCYPLRRIGAKGEGRFERIGWDEALGAIAERFKAIAASTDGPQSIVPYSYAGTMGMLQYGSMDRRFFHKLGASLLDRTICATAGKAGYIATIGAAIGTDLEQFENARLILIWGSNPVVSNLHLWSRIAGSQAPRCEAYRRRSLPQPDAPKNATITWRCCRVPTRRSRSA